VKIGNRNFEPKNHTYVMGILNVTPDSFSDGGRWTDVDTALRRAETMAAEGAALIDLGGESTRPGHTPIPASEELERVLPVLEALKANVDLPISLDTSKAEVARAGLAAGADLINDIWGLKRDPDMAKVIAAAGAPCCLMHNRESERYGLFFADMMEDLQETLSLGEQAGISREKIILDPGVGFAKSQEQNLAVLNRLEELHSLGCPLLLGASRKRVIGNALNLSADQRLEGTLTTTVFAVMKGCMFVRVHDVAENVRSIRMAEAILGER
jgi:dihydropteroate synthase